MSAGSLLKLGGLPVIAVLAACSETAGVAPGEVRTYSAPMVQGCSDRPVSAPMPFTPGRVIRSARGTIHLNLRYAVEPSGRVAAAVVERIALGDDARALAGSQIDALRQDIPEQIETEWRHAAGGEPRICEVRFSWRWDD